MIPIDRDEFYKRMDKDKYEMKGAITKATNLILEKLDKLCKCEPKEVKKPAPLKKK